MTPEQCWKRIQRQLRSIPVDAIAPHVAAGERDGRWCLVDGELVFVPADDSDTETCWGDPLEYAQFVRFVKARPERVHETMESAKAFVRASRAG